jgi:hypothetical protein
MRKTGERERKEGKGSMRRNDEYPAPNDGLMDEFQIYGRVLSSAEVLDRAMHPCTDP